LEMGNKAKLIECLPQAQLAAFRPPKGDTLIAQRACPISVAKLNDGGGQGIEPIGDPGHIADLAPECQCFLVQCGRRAIVSALPRQAAAGAQTEGTDRERNCLRDRCGTVEPGLPFGQIALCPPEPAQRARHAQAMLPVAALDAPTEGRPQVRLLDRKLWYIRLIDETI